MTSVRVTILPDDNNTIGINCSNIENTSLQANEADYCALNDTIYFLGKKTKQTLSVKLIDNTVPEGQERLIIKLSQPQGCLVPKWLDRSIYISDREDCKRYITTYISYTIDVLLLSLYIHCSMFPVTSFLRHSYYLIPSFHLSLPPSFSPSLPPSFYAPFFNTDSLDVQFSPIYEIKTYDEQCGLSFEVSEDIGTFNLVLTRKGNLDLHVGVVCYTVPGLNQQGVSSSDDYIHRPNTNDSYVYFLPGQTEANCSITIIDDQLNEPSEYFEVKLATRKEDFVYRNNVKSSLCVFIDHDTNDGK